MVKVNGSRFAAEVLNGNARINLTQMSKPFGRSCRPGDWLRTEEAQRYLHAISVAQKCATADLLEVRQGGDPPAGAGDQRHVGVHADMRANGQQTAGSACPEVVLRPEGRRTAGSHETGHDVTDGIIDFNGMEGE